MHWLLFGINYLSYRKSSYMTLILFISDDADTEFAPSEINNILRVITAFIGGIGLIMFFKIFLRLVFNKI